MTFKPTLIALGLLLPISQASADLLNSLVAYYDFEETGMAGLANKAPGASSFNAIRAGTNATFTDWSNSADATGPGFAGKVDFTGALTSGVSDRSVLKIGKALNLDDDRDEYVVVPLGSAQLGSSFTISAWHKLAPGATNNSNRYHVFESSDNFDVSWGTLNTAFTTPQSAYQYLAYIGEGPAGGFGPTGVSTNQWHHVVHSVTSDGTTTTLKVYLDGAFFNSRTVATSLVSFTNLHFGRHRTFAGSDREWDGMIDEVALWNRALSANDAKELYLRGNSSIPVTLDLATLNKAFISVVPSNAAGGQAFGTDLYNVGDTVFAQALHATGYLFTSWSSPYASQPESFDFVVSTSLEITATFSPDLADDDSDGLSNFAELTLHHTAPTVADTDGDLILDGQEINSSLTNPLVSQTPAINWIIANLSTGGAQPGDIVLTRNAGNNTVSLKLNTRDSTTLNGDWAPVSSASPGVYAAVAGGAVKITIPGNPEAKRFFQTSGTTP